MRRRQGQSVPQEAVDEIQRLKDELRKTKASRRYFQEQVEEARYYARLLKADVQSERNKLRFFQQEQTESPFLRVHPTGELTEASYAYVKKHQRRRAMKYSRAVPSAEEKMVDQILSRCETIRQIIENAELRLDEVRSSLESDLDKAKELALWRNQGFENFADWWTTVLRISAEESDLPPWYDYPLSEDYLPFW
ncbi:hypothetical protein [Nesterenkonia ebinurensis]|uniref:hypothetical protein n=1 Tax=Nesterenkonia ebinurensis TaxID=2608252 RepID=UPI00123DD84D|nr:hypothetical protein [Nesterenkonia ebinurensis]